MISRIGGFTSSAQSSIIEVPERGAILVTDYEPVVQRIARLVELVDAAGEPIVTTIVSTQHQPPERLVTPVQTVLQAEMPPVRKGAEVNVLPDIVPGALVIVGPEEGVQRAQSLIAQFDQPREDVRPTRIYTPRYTSAARLRTLVQNVVLAEAGLGKDAVHLYVDDVANSLYVTASPPLQEQIRELVEREDQSMPAAARRLRVYRPRNRPVAELLDTLTQLLEEASVNTILSSREVPTAEEAVSGPPGPNRPPGPLGPGQIPPMPPAQEPIASTAPAEKAGRRVVGPDYVLTEDESTNAILAVGTPEFHEELSALIDQLDRRRGQVLIEMTLVAVTLNDALRVGVELESLDLGEPWDYLLFSSFGLSELDVGTGQRVLAPGVGANGVLIGPKEVPFLFQALATHGDTRIISTPRIVVSDHATATLKNVDEAPFTSVNASDTVATTSFAGFEAAGTTLTVTPHLAEGDHLSLKYDLTFSSFSGASSSATIPPPRTTNSFSAELDVPDGYTVIVGGLEIENQSDTVSEVPLVGRIPLLGVLFQNSAASRTRTRIFAFVRPVILRDDQFQDLRFFSERALERADVESGDFPRDETMWMQ
ncbi:MAG: hypothetical protein JXB13_01555 [Phycisphaerae bacterium]|nr:hypothetical protein [Phycisphaerae bacterium]